MTKIEYPRVWRKIHRSGKTIYLCDPCVKFFYYPPAYGNKPASQLTAKERADALNYAQDLDSTDFETYHCVFRKEIEGTQWNALALPSGYYELMETHQEVGLTSMATRNQEDTIPLGKQEDELRTDIDQFLANKSYFDKLNIFYKRGILLYGPPGTGKTTLIRRVISSLNREFICIHCDDTPDNYLIDALRKDPRIKIIIFEEIRGLTQGVRLQRLLTFLDGEASLDNCIIIGTTNYAAELPGNIVERPSRFDLVMRISDPDESTIVKLIEFYLSRKPTQAEVLSMQGYSTAFIKEACMQSKFKNISIKDALKEITNRAEIAKKDFGERQKEGIGFSRDD